MKLGMLTNLRMGIVDGVQFDESVQGPFTTPEWRVASLSEEEATLLGAAVEAMGESGEFVRPWRNKLAVSTYRWPSQLSPLAQDWAEWGEFSREDGGALIQALRACPGHESVPTDLATHAEMLPGACLIPRLRERARALAAPLSPGRVRACDIVRWNRMAYPFGDPRTQVLLLCSDGPSWWYVRQEGGWRDALDQRARVTGDTSPVLVENRDVWPREGGYSTIEYTPRPGRCAECGC